MRRRSVFWLPVLATLPAVFPAAARETSYLAPGALDLAAILPPPVAVESYGDKAQLAVVAEVQARTSPERLEKARRDDAVSLEQMFGAGLGKLLAAARLPATTRMFDRLAETCDGLVAPAKQAFGRVRPWKRDPAIKALVTPPLETGSYPSGHGTIASATAVVLSAMLPEKRAAVFEVSHDYAWSRVLVGMHYARDLDGGEIAGTAIAVAVRDLPAFRADAEAARRELRAYLGLAP